MAYVLANEGVQTVVHRTAGVGAWAAPGYVGWGTGAGTAATSHTTLFTEASESRVAATVTVETDILTDDTLQAVGTLTSASSQTITNAGVFDVSNKTDASDKMFMKGDFTGIGVDSGDAIQFTFKWRLNN